MKIIDLLNKIANGEEVPKKIKIDGTEFEWCETCEIYESDRISLYKYLMGGFCLDDEVEIEEKKIEHIGKEYDITDFKREYPKVAELVKDLNNKQYEIIDKLNEVLNNE